MKKSSRLRFAAAAALIGGAGVLAVSCGKSSTKSAAKAGSEMTISGSLNIAAGLTQFNVATEDLSIYCVSFTNPPVAGTGDIAADGAFSLKLKAVNTAIGCFILDQDGESLATLVFKDSTEKDMGGSASEQQRMAFTGSTNLGAIALDTTTGKATADIANFKSKIAKSNNDFDFTGTWKASKVDNLPAGIVSVCPPRTDGEGDDGDECRGPEDGMLVYFKRIVGKKADGSKGYATQLWDSEAAFNSCGKKLGISIATAKAQTGIDFTGSIEDGVPTWATSATINGSAVTLTDGWKASNATARHNYSNCYQATRGGASVHLCKDLGGNVQIGKSGSCKFNDNGSVVKMDNKAWGELTPGTPTTDGDWSINSSTGTKDGRAFTCTHSMSFCNSDNMATATCSPNGTFDWNDVQVINQNQSCNTGGDELAKLKCYSDFYRGTIERGNVEGCFQKVGFNWGATTASQFVQAVETDRPQTAAAQMGIGLLKYTGSGTATFSVDHEETQMISVGGNSQALCKIREDAIITLKKVSDTRLMAELTMVESAIGGDPACYSEYKGKNMKSVFMLEKQ